MIPEPIRVTLLVTEVLNSLDVTYAVGGSLAAAVHGVIRSTLDVDILAEIKLEQIDRFVECLESSFYMDVDMITDAVIQRSTFNIIHRETFFKVDIFLTKNRAFERAELMRREKQPVEESQQSIYFVTAEDIILAKLEWYCLGGEISERQWHDVLGILRNKRGNLDLEYLFSSAQQIHVAHLLQRALHEAGG